MFDVLELSYACLWLTVHYVVMNIHKPWHPNDLRIGNADSEQPVFQRRRPAFDRMHAEYRRMQAAYESMQAAFTTVMQAAYGRLQTAYDGMQAANDGTTTVCSLHYDRKCSLHASVVGTQHNWTQLWSKGIIWLTVIFIRTKTTKIVTASHV